MKHLSTIVITFCFLLSAMAQEDFIPEFDGTKYYLLIYDGEGNEKVLSFHSEVAAWTDKIGFDDYFDGSNKQLWVFEEADEVPGYINVRNLDEALTDKHYLKSWNWNAYLESQSGDREGDQEHDLELVFRFKQVFEGWQALETIEKPEGLYGIAYTPGADALNINESGIAWFKDLKTSDITPENATYKVFKPVVFDPVALFASAIERGQGLYDSHADAPEKTRYDLFYVLEKARSVRVFGTDGEMLDFQPELDSAIERFQQTLGLLTYIEDGRAFIDTLSADPDVKDSYNAILDQAEVFIHAADLDYGEIETVASRITGASDLVLAIGSAQLFHESLSEYDARLSAGLSLSIDTAKFILANTSSEADAFSSAVSHLERTREIIEEIIWGIELIETTQDFEEAKEDLTLALDQAIEVINSPGTSVSELDQALLDIQNGLKAFQRALEAGDTPIELNNADFEADLAEWIVDSPNPEAAYPENKGVDGSRSITFWKGSDYQMKVYQSIRGIPDGTYQVSCFAMVNVDSTIAVFAESGPNSTVLPVADEGGLTKRVLEVVVSDGSLIFGVRGSGEDNAIPANSWIVFDEFEVKWASKAEIINPGFEEDFTGWFKESDVDWMPYIENKGVDGSKSVTFWKGGNYRVILSQTLSGLSDGKYIVSAMTNASADSSFVIFGESGGQSFSEHIMMGGLTKHKLFVEVKNGSITFGARGSAENDSVPAGHWVVIDNFEVVRQPDMPVINPGFEEDFSGWFKESDVDWMPYIENKGVDGSKSVTFWQGADYRVTLSQTISGLFDGNYEVSAMTNASVDSSFVVFGESDGQILTAYIHQGGLTKHKLGIPVTGGSLSLGAKGSGENDSVPAGHWVVLDDFEVLIKSIVPVYDMVELNPEQILSSGIEPGEAEHLVYYWQSDQRLHIHSDDILVSCAIYSITGSLVELKMIHNTDLSIPISRGIYIVRVLVEDGFVDTKKVIIP